MKKYLLLSCSLFIVFIGLSVYYHGRFFDGRLHIFFCDVGQGDGIYIRTPQGFDIVVDGGPDTLFLDCLAHNRPFWDRKIELLFATHPDADHISGLVEVLRRFDVASVNISAAESDTDVYKQLVSAIAVEKTRMRYVYSHDSYKTPDGVIIQQLWPARPQGSTGSQTTNSQSLIQLIRYKEFEMLLTGDADAVDVDTVIASLRDIDILKLSHHGSRTGTDGQTFTKVKPGLAVLSLGKKNRYGHPHKEVLAQLEKYNIPYKRTDKNGTIQIITDGSVIRIVTDMN